MSFLSRLFKKKKEPDAPPQVAQAPPPKPAPKPAPPPAVRTEASAPSAPAPKLEVKPAAPPTPSVPPPAPPQPPQATMPLSTLPPAPTPAAATSSQTVAFDAPKPAPPPPPAGAAAAAAPQGGGVDLEDGFFDDFLDDFDANFDSVIAGDSAPAAVAASPEGFGVVYEQSPVRELFADIAANYVRSVRNFMIEVNRGDTAKEWIEICQPAVLSIKRAAEKMELSDVYKAVDDFDAVLELAAGTEGRMIAGDVRNELIATYAELVELMPQAFTLEAERDQRESIIIHSLLMQVPDVKKVTIDKIYGAGLTTLDVIFLAKPEDLAATAGVPEWLAAKIVDKFQAYRREMQAVTPDASRSAERAKLATLVSDLKQQQEGYERASGGWTEDAAEEKKRLRQARQDTLLQINVVLAQLGEVDLIHEIEKLPFERRIERLQAYLTEGPAGDVPM